MATFDAKINGSVVSDEMQFLRNLRIYEIH